MRARRASNRQRGTAMQQVSMSTSWKRRSDKPTDRTKSDHSPCALERVAVTGHARQPQGWANDRGNNAAPSDPLRLLIVDNDIASATWLDRTLHALGVCDTRVAYSGHAALAITAEFHPRVVLLELELAGDFR